MLKNVDTKTNKHFIPHPVKEKLNYYTSLPLLRGTDNENIYFENKCFLGFNHTGDKLSVFSKQGEDRKINTWSCYRDEDIITLNSCIGVKGTVNNACFKQDCLYNPATNSIMNLFERRLEVGVEISIKAFWLEELQNQSNTAVDFLDTEPLLVLTYEGINLYRCFTTETKHSNFLVMFASGYKYGFKACHVDFSDGIIIDLLKYNHTSLIHFKRIKIDESVYRFPDLSFGVGKLSEIFVGSNSPKPNIFLFCCDHKELIEISNDGANTVAYDIVENSHIKLFKHCYDSSFIYVTEETSAKIVNFQGGKSQIIREIPLNIEGNIVALSLFQKFNKLLLCMQNCSGALLIIDLLAGKTIFELPLNQLVISSLQMNWNMEELAVTETHNNDNKLKSIHVFKIPQFDLSLKNLARISVLTNFTRRELLLSSLPESVKNYLALF